MPYAVIVFKYDFFLVILVSCIGGITGNIIFTNLSALFLKWLQGYRLKRGIKKKIFTKTVRVLIRVKQKFGLIGIAAITPIISQPVGAFFAEKFFKDKKKIIIYLSISIIIWSFCLYFMLFLFHDQLKDWGII